LRDIGTNALDRAPDGKANGTRLLTAADYEDNLVLDLAAEVGAILIVSHDTDLLSMSPWRGTPVLTPVAFAAKVDAMRRHGRRRRR
jgi:predicted nucleic acid-binding protein